jgi:NAD(P)-dependent dehydrogenase (short-subunit alcohol dehydrogenase family)
VEPYCDPDSAPNLMDQLSLKNRNALVVGGAGLLGGEISFVLAELGARVFIASRNGENCHAFAQRVMKRHPSVQAEGLTVDITVPDTIRSLGIVIDQRTGGKLDILINSAWSGNSAEFENTTDVDWNFHIEVGISGVFRVIKTMFPLLRATQGNVVSIASMYGHLAPDYRMYEGQGSVNPPAYGAVKAGVIQLTKYLASFLAPHHVRVNCISPGPFPYPSRQREQPNFIARLNAKNPLGRIGRPHEIKGTIALLCSDAGAYMTGQNICVDGGWSVW